MKKRGFLMLLAVGLVVVQPGTVRASDGWAAFGGFLGGMIVSDLACRPRTVYVNPAPIVERTVVVREPYREVVVRQPVREVIVREPVREVIVREPVREVVVEEVYEEVVVREPVRVEFRTSRAWIPGTYSYRADRCGGRVRVWSPGYYRDYRPRVHAAPRYYRSPGRSVHRYRYPRYGCR